MTKKDLFEVIADVLCQSLMNQGQELTGLSAGNGKAPPVLGGHAPVADKTTAEPEQTGKTSARQQADQAVEAEASREKSAMESNANAELSRREAEAKTLARMGLTGCEVNLDNLLGGEKEEKTQADRPARTVSRATRLRTSSERER